MKLWPWLVLTAVCATISTTLALYLHRDDECVTTSAPVEIPTPIVREVRVPAPPPPPVAAVECVRELPFGANAYPQIEVAGTLVRGVRWHDAHGENVVVFSDVRARTPFDASVLHAAHYIVAGTSTRHVRTIRQRTECKDGDMISRFAAGYRVTDLDDDGIGELMFGLFHGACPTDVSPGDFKLFLLEDGAKYVLRGPGHMKLSGDLYGVPKPTSRSVAGASDVFVNHLDTYWTWLSDQWKGDQPL